ncbi:hypothetical protein LPMP_202430 [Leishmania panamensis]|uniref:PH-like domain-containing protein n=1 Tax=Leishmania panamensis TaxID=5679 RepID=A0A088RRB3_LEIPA|nr:hypothetical protein LPMP_202430 [Leishmania panamensis]AIN97739.1 hypothetical protein LPMP_202430 [Leishmania panamensis]
MSSWNGRQLRSSSRGGDNGLRRESSAKYLSDTRPRSLLYGNGGGFRSRDPRMTIDDSDRYYNIYTPRWGCPSASGGARTTRVEDMPVGSTSRDDRRRHANRSSGINGPMTRGRSGRGGDGWYDASSSRSASSYTYSYSSSDLSSGDASSEGGARARSRVYSGSRVQQRPQKKSLQPTPHGGVRSQLRATSVGSPPLDAPPPGAIRWVGGGRRDTETQAGEEESRTGPLSRWHADANEQDGLAMNAEPLRPLISAQMPSLKPTGLLRRIIAAVAHYRGVPPPPSVPSEVILAFDEYVSSGSTMLKFIPHGPPHPRFFVIRFLNVMAGLMRSGGGRAYDQEPSVLYAVLSWYRTLSSRRMIRFLPLHDLIEVRASGTDHQYVRRRTVQPGILRGPRSGFVTNYVRADFILQFRFCSRLSQAEETLAIMAANRAEYLAWLVVGTFISQIGNVC